MATQKTGAKAAESKATGMEVAMVSREELSLCEFSQDDLRDLYVATMGDAPLDLRALDWIKVPSGEGLSWTVTDANGEPQSVTHFESIILASHTTRAYWSTPFGSGKSPPDCRSDDCIHGVGMRWNDDEEGEHSCFGCRWDEFGTATRPDGSQGRGKACAERIWVLHLFPDSIVPGILRLPVTSFMPYKKYVQATLMGRHKTSPRCAVTRWALTREKNAEGIDYAVVSPTVARVLDRELQKEFSQLVEVLVERFKATTKVTGFEKDRALDEEEQPHPSSF